MKNMLEAPFLQEYCKVISNMYRLGWDERNGGNVSILLSKEEVSPYVNLQKVLRVLPLHFDAKGMEGRYILVTGTGKYFRNVEGDPEKNAGLVRIAQNGQDAELLWGFSDGGTFTSEFPAHLMSHRTRLAIDPEHRVVMHCHPTNTLAMNFVHPLEERSFTRSLWKTCTECIVVFPEGVGVLPWMVCGTEEIGRATAEKMKEYRIVLWGMHGIYGVGRDLDEAFGLIETVEKAAQLYMLTAHLPRINTIEDTQLAAVAKRFGLHWHPGFLDVEE